MSTPQLSCFKAVGYLVQNPVKVSMLAGWLAVTPMRELVFIFYSVWSSCSILSFSLTYLMGGDVRRKGARLKNCTYRFISMDFYLKEEEGGGGRGEGKVRERRNDKTSAGQ